ncbi:hypothetical protein B0H14DRAFT_3447773 [Mycena olivaceomarginata]|nr:hypothetical protein B0H14DRAFT_3447773 [Mycena olivaceomarginata]
MPLAFYDTNGGGEFDDFAFQCGGRHYFHGRDYDTVRRYHRPYASPAAFLDEQIRSFHVASPQSARHAKLFAQGLEVMRRPTSGVRSMVKRTKQYNSVMDELRAESRNPPANDLYTELFRNRSNTE